MEVNWDDFKEVLLVKTHFSILKYEIRTRRSDPRILKLSSIIWTEEIVT